VFCESISQDPNTVTCVGKIRKKIVIHTNNAIDAKDFQLTLQMMELYKRQTIINLKLKSFLFKHLTDFFPYCRYTV